MGLVGGMPLHYNSGKPLHETRAASRCTRQERYAAARGKSGMLLHNKSGKPLQSKSGKPLKIKNGKPLQSKSGKPLKTKAASRYKAKAASRYNTKAVSRYKAKAPSCYNTKSVDDRCVFASDMCTGMPRSLVPVRPMRPIWLQAPGSQIPGARARVASI
jgi:hypothetical protein